MPSHRTIVSAVLVAAAGCGTTEPAPTYLDVSGTFAGSSSGIQQGRKLDLNLSLVLTQQGGTLTGTYSAVGGYLVGELPVLVDYESSFTGTIGSGDNPLVGLVLARSDCPDYQAHFGGHYNGTDSVLAIAGPFDLFQDGGCSIATSYPMTIFLTRPPPTSSAVSRP